MRDYQELFKTEFLSGVFRMVKFTWWKYVIIYLIQAILMIIAFIPLLLSIFNFDAFEELIKDPEGYGELIRENPELMFSFLGADANFTGIIIGGSIFMIIMMLVGSWTTNAYFKLNQAVIHGGNADLGHVLGTAFDKKFGQILGLSLVLFVIYLLVIAICVGLGFAAHWSLGALASLAGMVFMLRLIIAAPAIVHGDMGISDAIAFSMQKIDFGRSLKLALAGILFVAALVIASIVISLLSFILLLIPILGFIIYYAIQLSFSGSINAFTFGAMSGLYYRYAENALSELDISVHLTDQQ